MKSVHAIITGRVQGVFYRAWTAEEAVKLGLAGWVRNLSDGTVEAVFSGDDARVDAMLAKCRQGPRRRHPHGAHRPARRARFSQAPHGVRGEWRLSLRGA